MEQTSNEFFFAGGCLWGVQEFCRYLPGVLHTSSGRANGTSSTLHSSYDGYAECVRIEFDTGLQSVTGLLPYLFEIIDPHSLNRQGEDAGLKYRTGVYSRNNHHLEEARLYIQARPDSDRVVVEVLPLTNFILSAAEHQDRLTRCPDDYCHISPDLLYKYR